MFESFKFHLSKRLGFYGEHDVINHNIKNYKEKSEELENLLKLCDSVITNIKDILNNIEININAREIDILDLAILKLNIERIKNSFDYDINKVINLEKKYRQLLKENIILYFNKLKMSEYHNNDLNNMYLDLISNSKNLLSNIVFRKYFDNEMFFKELLKKVVDKNNNSTIEDIEFVLEKLELIRSTVYRKSSMISSNIVDLELSEKKQKYDKLDEIYSSKRR